MVLQPTALDKAEAVACSPRVAIGQLQIVVDLFEDELVAGNILVEMALASIETGVSVRERFPQLGAPISVDLEDGLGACPLAACGNLVVGLVGKEGGFCVDAAGRQPACAGDEKPVIGAADQAHEEGRHLVIVVNAVIGLAQHLYICAGRRLVTAVDRHVIDQKIADVCGHRFVLSSSGWMKDVEANPDSGLASTSVGLHSFDIRATLNFSRNGRKRACARFGAWS